MKRNRLTRAQKLKNKALYKNIRKAYDSVKDKNTDITYKQFKNRVNAQKEANPNLSWREAIHKETRTETFFSAAERSRENLLKSIKEEFADQYKEIRRLSRDDSGKFKKLELEWTNYGKKSGYSFIGAHNKRYFIDTTNSPKEVLIYEIQI